LNFVLPEYDETLYIQNQNLLYLHIIYDVVLFTIAGFYLKKIAKLIPFGFGFLNEKYKYGLKGDGLIALDSY